MRTLTALPAALAVVAVLGVAAAATPVSATLYKWTDADGVIHYSDRPVPGAQEVHVNGAQTYKSSKPAPAAPRPAAARRKPTAYTSVEVTRPSAGEGFLNPGGSIQAAASVEPGLSPGHQLWFVLDGQRLPDPAGDSLTATLPVERGAHTVAVLITDEDGQDVISSEPVQFFIRGTSILKPPQGPLVRSPKKP